MLTITRRIDGQDTTSELAPVGYQVPDSELADMYAALFADVPSDLGPGLRVPDKGRAGLRAPPRVGTRVDTRRSP